MKVNTALMASVALSMGTAFASNWTGGGTDSLWTTAGNWDTPPVAGDEVFVDALGNSPLVDMDVAAEYGNVYFGVTKTDEVVLTMQPGGHLRTDSSGYIVFGDQAATSARCEMTGGTLSGKQVRIGANGTGTLNMSGGDITVSDWVGVGVYSGGTGTFNMTGGSVDAYNINPGSAGKGTVDISGGTVKASNWIGIAKYSGAAGSSMTIRNSGGVETKNLSVGLDGNGTLNLQGGTLDLLNTGRMRIGEVKGAGTFNVSGGQAYVDSYVSVGFSANSIGTNVVKATSGGLNARQIIVGDNAKGRLEVSGTGHVVVRDWIGVGKNSGGNGVFTLDGGTVETFKLSVGLAGPGEFDMTGGTLVLTNRSDARIRIGEGVATGIWNMEGGSVVAPYYISIGHSNTPGGPDIMNMSDGDVDTGAFVVGLYGTGEFNMSGGHLHVDETYFGSGRIRIGEGTTGSGTWNMQGGLAEATKAVQLGYGLTTNGAQNVLNMSGGEVRTTTLQVGMAGDGIVNLSGGVFSVSGTATNGLLFDTADGDGQINLEGGVLRWLGGDYTAEVNAQIASNNIVAYNGTDTVKVSYDAGSNWTTIEASSASYNQWATGYGLSGADAEKAADPDADGFDNLHEYALGGNPTDPADQGIVPTYGFSGGVMTYVYPKRAAANSGLSYHIETNPDLVYGGWANSGYTETGTGSIDTEFNAVTNEIPTDVESEQFVRLIIEEQ